MSKTAGFIHGPTEHHLDHIAPLCALLEIPLIVTDEKIDKLARAFYPGLDILYFSYLEAPERVVSSYDTLYTCLPRLLFEEIFFIPQKLLGKIVRTIWVPHGNSDKGRAQPLMEALKDETRALVYGQQMIDFLKQKNVYDHLETCETVGNYRLRYWEKHRSFYDALVPRPAGKIILYAPTWNDAEKSTSYFDLLPHLASHAPPGTTLVLRPHPHLPRADLPSHIHLVTDFPPVYPWLAIADIYLGDMSSVGYDFLHFRRPMFFLNQNRRTDPLLYRCGTVIDPSDYSRIYDILAAAHNDPFSKIQEELYATTFHECKTV